MADLLLKIFKYNILENKVVYIMTLYGSRKTAGVAIEMALPAAGKEKEYKQALQRRFRTAAVDYGGDFISSVNKLLSALLLYQERRRNQRATC